MGKELKPETKKQRRYRILVLIDGEWEEIWVKEESKEKAFDKLIHIVNGIETLRYKSKPIEVFI